MTFAGLLAFFGCFWILLNFSANFDLVYLEIKLYNLWQSSMAFIGL
jgi:hypothetical protein